jgi:hypothetical protein
MGEACSKMAEKRNTRGLLVGKPKGKRPRRRWLNNTKIDV